MDWSFIIESLLPWAGRLAINVFTTLGVVYLFGRLLFPKLNKRTVHADKVKNRIAALALFVVTVGTSFAYDFPGLLRAMPNPNLIFRFSLDVAIYYFIGIVFYVVVGWRFYSRIDDLLDRKIGRDKK